MEPNMNIEPTKPQMPENELEKEVPGFIPAESPQVPPLPSTEFDPGKRSPEIMPAPSPNANPPSSPPEIQPLNRA